ncbi:MAG: radical SAM protein [Candidatus Omnitrophica bacterium]|nr:radical SAM protein [Candidatus Omnitrophota bacterium]
MLKEGEPLTFHFPSKVYTSVRGTRTLYYSPDRGVCVAVNEAGRDILEACRSAGTLTEIACCLTSGRKSFVPLIEDLIRPFLSKMKRTRFLSDGKTPENGDNNSVSQPAPIKFTTLYLHVTDTCNLRCIYCYNQTQRSQKKISVADGSDAPLTSAQIHGLLDESARLKGKEIVFTGGEPLFRKDLCELAAYAKAKGLSTSLLTNGTLIDRGMAAKIAGSFDSVVVSFDSWVKKEYETLRPGAPFENAVQGIRNLVTAKVAAVFIRPVITTLNLGSLPEFPRFAAEHLGCLDFLPAAYLPNHAEDLETMRLLPDPEEYWATLHRFYANIKKLGGRAVSESIPLEAAGSCGAGGSVLSIAPNGDVYPCQCLHFDGFIAGNFKEQSLAEIIDGSQVLASFREQSWPWFAPCSECALMSICASTCRVFPRVFRENEELFFERMCPFFKKEIENRLWEEAEKQDAVKKLTPI